MTEEAKQECSICCEGYLKLQEITSECKHNDACPVCIKRHIEAELNSKGDIVQVRCPKSRCTTELTFDDVRRLATKELFERYDTLLLRNAIRKLPDFRWCKAPKCGSGQEHTTGDRLPIMTCSACSAKSCFTHDVPWHQGLTCAQFTEQLESKDYTANRAYYERLTKQCPSCQMSIEKNQGCDHMSCRCGYEFCWLCLGDYENIRNNGNHYHAPTCQYYAAYNSEDEHDVDDYYDEEEEEEYEYDDDDDDVGDVDVVDVNVDVDANADVDVVGVDVGVDVGVVSIGVDVDDVDIDDDFDDVDDIDVYVDDVDDVDVDDVYVDDLDVVDDDVDVYVDDLDLEMEVSDDDDDDDGQMEELDLIL